jgi:phosphoadenosine phosphosulfate reductase
MLVENTLLGTIDKVQIAIERLQQFEPPEGYYLAFSGGKDSICIYQLALMSGVKFDAHYNFVGVEAPEVLKFIRDNYPDVIWERPEKTMWELIEHKRYPPTRIVRYCCSYLKERANRDRFKIIGVRRQESNIRRNRAMVDTCYKTGEKHINPIIDWTEKDVWQFIKENNFKYPCLYDEGYKRIGCIMCPMQGTKGMLKDVKRYPNFYKAYLKAFRKMLEKNRIDGKGLGCNTTETAEEIMHHWIEGKFRADDKDLLFEEEQIFNYE